MASLHTCSLMFMFNHQADLINKVPLNYWSSLLVGWSIAIKPQHAVSQTIIDTFVVMSIRG